MLIDYENPYEVARRLRDDELISLQLVHAAADLLVTQANLLKRACSGNWQEVRNELIKDALRRQTAKNTATKEAARAYLAEHFPDRYDEEGNPREG